MHEEDGGKGLKVKSPSGATWTCYGDAKLFQTNSDSDKATNMEHCREALHQSVQEVYEAYKNKKTIPESSFGAWKLAPDLTKINELNPDHHPLLFVKEGKLYTRNGGPESTSSICMDDRYAATAYLLWANFYRQNSQWVAAKLWKYLGLG